jgi:hypothetical protein
VLVDVVELTAVVEDELEVVEVWVLLVVVVLEVKAEIVDEVVDVELAVVLAELVFSTAVSVWVEKLVDDCCEIWPDPVGSAGWGSCA